MAVLPIAKLGNPVLRKIAASVDLREIRTREFQQLIDDMYETMLEEPGIGLAAPQVSRSIQLVVMACEGEGGFPTTTLRGGIICPSVISVRAPTMLSSPSCTLSMITAFMPTRQFRPIVAPWIMAPWPICDPVFNNTVIPGS